MLWQIENEQRSEASHNFNETHFINAAAAVAAIAVAAAAGRNICRKFLNL